MTVADTPAASPPPGRGNDKATAKALAFVVRSTKARPQTEAEVAAKLAGRGFAQDEIDLALQRARAAGVVDDRAFARAWVADRGVRRGYAAARLRQELRRRLVAEAIVEEALATEEVDDPEAVAADLARRRVASMPASLSPEAVTRRLVGHLVRRGYPPALSQRVALRVSGLDRRWD